MYSLKNSTVINRGKIFISARILVSLLLLSIIGQKNAIAQQDPQFSQYMFNKMVFNPGFTGIHDVATASVLYRDQWLGFDGAPSSQYISFDSPVEKAFGGMGISVLNDVIGTQRTTNANLNYAFRVMFPTKDNTYRSLSGGLSVNLTQFTIDGSVFRSPDGYYENGTVDHNDGAIPNGVASDFTADMSFGIYYFANGAYGGVSMTHLLGSSLNIDGVVVDYSRNLFLMTGRTFDLGTYYDLMPSILYKTTFRKSQFDLNFNLMYNNEIWFGVGLRGITRFSVDAFVFNVGAHVTNQVSVGYSYDVTTSNIGAFSGGTHEFSLKYRLENFGFGRNTPEEISCPRDL